jgi:hypothetical protein
MIRLSCMQSLQHTNKFTVFGLCLLIVYGHEPHKILAGLGFCKQNLIEVVCLSIHTT